MHSFEVVLFVGWYSCQIAWLLYTPLWIQPFSIHFVADQNSMQFGCALSNWESKEWKRVWTSTIHCYIVSSYGAVENFKEENIHELVESTIFAEKTYTDWSFVPQMDTKLPNFAEWIATKPRNSQKFFPSKVFHYLCSFQVCEIYLWRVSCWSNGLQ